jgi:carbonic anhydrase
MGFGTLIWMDKIYLATEVHFHHPSEHALGDNEFRMDMEI